MIAPPFQKAAAALGCRCSLRRIGTIGGMLAVTLFSAGCGVAGSRDSDSSSPASDSIERTAEKGPVKLFVRVSPSVPRLSDLVEMEVIIQSQPNVELKAPAFGQAVGDFLVRDYSERPPEVNSGNSRRFRYQLEPTHAGKHLIRSVSIEFVDRRPDSEGDGQPALIETDPLEVNVTSEWGDDTPSLANLEPMLPPQPVPQAIETRWLIAAGVAVAIAIPVIVMWQRRNRQPIAPRRQTPEEIAHAALAELLAENLPVRGLIKEFYLRLTGIVRQYIEDTTGIHAPEQTTAEFLRDMWSREVFSPERSNRLQDFLEAADLVKYAGQQPGERQIDEALSRAREFVDLKPIPARELAGTGVEQVGIINQ